jgi:uncharacterized phage protein gp47/JayE
MAFQIPSLLDLVQRARQNFRSYLPGTDAWLWPNNIGPTAKVVAGLTHETFGFAEYISRQKFAMTADSENLDMHGAELGMSRRSAQPSSGMIEFTASTALVVETDATVARADGVSYRVTTGGALLAPGTLLLPVVSESDGKDTIAFGGTDLLAVAGITGTADIVVGVDGIVGGSDREGDEPWRERILFRKRNPPQGGSASDYVIWASEVPGVTRVFVERIWAGPGTIRVFPIFDDDYPGGIAPAARIAQVRNHLEPLRPAGSALTVSAPNAATINVTVAGLVPNTTTVQEAVRTELGSAIRRLGRVAGINDPVSSMPYLATPLSFSRSWIWQAAANAAGEQAHAIAIPDADVAIPTGSIPVLGSVSF